MIASRIEHHAAAVDAHGGLGDGDLEHLHRAVAARVGDACVVAARLLAERVLDADPACSCCCCCSRLQLLLPWQRTVATASVARLLNSRTTTTTS